MRITSYDAMKQYLDAGGHLKLNSRGELKTQNAIAHAFQTVKDAILSLSPGGRARIAARNAALSRAMDAMVRQNALINPARTGIPRLEQRGQAPSAQAGMSTAAAAGPAQPAAPRSLEALTCEVRTVAEEIVNQTWPELDAGARADLLSGILESLRGLPELVRQAGGDAAFLRENVIERVRSFAGDVVPAGAQRQPAAAAGPAQPAAPRSLEALTREVRTVAEGIVNQTWPQLDAGTRADRLACILGALRDLPELVRQAGGDAAFLRRNVEACVSAFASAEHQAAESSRRAGAAAPATVAGQPSAELDDVVWPNWTPRHPRGVCEAATSLWLARIAEGGDQGLLHANRLTSTDCDELQARVERNSGWTFSLNLRELLPPQVTLHQSDVDFFEGIYSDMPNVIRGGERNSTVPDLLDTLRPGEFFYVNATHSTGNGHAMAVYRDGQQYHFFNPGVGIFHGTREQIIARMEGVVTRWANVTVHQGRMEG